MFRKRLIFVHTIHDVPDWRPVKMAGGVMARTHLGARLKVRCEGIPSGGRPFKITRTSELDDLFPTK